MITIYEEDVLVYRVVDELNYIMNIYNINYRNISDTINIDPGFIHKILNKKRKASLQTILNIIYAINTILMERENKNEEVIKLSKILENLGY